jgi:hypothetical protein
MKIKIADEVWIATALLHKENPDRGSFRVSEIVDRVYQEGLNGLMRPSVQAHVIQHCVANKRPSPAHHRMLYDEGQGHRRLFKSGDDSHPYRSTGKICPKENDIPKKYHSLLVWYKNTYNNGGDIN